MSEDKANIGDGNVEITLAGEKKVLVPSFKAFTAINDQFSGLIGALRAVQQFDASAIAFVVTHGLGYDNNQVKNVMEKIYKSGLGGGSPQGLAPKCIDYITNLMNGGRPPASLENVDQNP